MKEDLLLAKRRLTLARRQVAEAERGVQKAGSNFDWIADAARFEKEATDALSRLKTFPNDKKLKREVMTLAIEGKHKREGLLAHIRTLQKALGDITNPLARLEQESK